METLRVSEPSTIRKVESLLRFFRSIVGSAIAAVFVVQITYAAPVCATEHRRQETMTPDASPRLAAEERTARYFDHIVSSPVLLMKFLHDMPKGGDLHIHLTGSAFAESLISWARRDGMCVDLATMNLLLPPCNGGHGIATVAQAISEPKMYNDMIDAYSIRDTSADTLQSARDHFFAIFSKLSNAVPFFNADMIAEAADRAAMNNESYIELMWSPGMQEARSLADQLTATDDYDALFSTLAPKIKPIIALITAHLDRTETKVRRILKCGTSRELPGCRVTIRYLAQVIRNYSTIQVFAQSQLGFELVQSDSRFVGINLVGPEDYPQILRDYDEQMRILGYCHKRYPKVQLALHAGELTPAFAPANDLHFHIREAVDLAGAQRIGHGLDIRYEEDSSLLLKEMASKKIAVEISLTSNSKILGINGSDHPFQVYHDAGVPIVLSTDDGGILRTDLTREFERAIATYHLTYMELKSLVRNSLEYAFVGGASLWANTNPFKAVEACSGVKVDNPHPPRSCRKLLAQSERASLQWRLEAALSNFERKN
jgi:hypothetical protein